MLPQGYRVYPSVYTPQEAATLRDAITTRAVELVFTNNEVQVDPDDPNTLKLFTDPKLRKELLADPTMIWRNGNSRDPIISKSCGMIDIHFDPTVSRMVTFAERPYEIMTKVYGTPNLVHTQGPERVSIKAQGAVDMPKHIDSNPFYPEVNFPQRYQAFVVAECPAPEEGSANKRGGLCLLTNFHHYYDFFGRMFHPHDGPLDYPMCDSRFFVLPASPKDESFDARHLPALEEYAKMYVDYLYNDEIPEAEISSFFARIKKEGVVLPRKLPELKWTPIQTSPGDMVVWDQRLPHYSLANTCETPRIVAYCSLFPVTEKWYHSEERKWTTEMFTKGEFYYTANAGVYPRRVRNPEEAASMDLDEFRKIVKTSKNGLRLTGERSWF